MKRDNVVLDQFSRTWSTVSKLEGLTLILFKFCLYWRANITVTLNHDRNLGSSFSVKAAISRGDKHVASWAILSIQWKVQTLTFIMTPTIFWTGWDWLVRFHLSPFLVVSSKHCNMPPVFILFNAYRKKKKETDLMESKECNVCFL